jgi:hypothetical protein
MIARLTVFGIVLATTAAGATPELQLLGAPPTTEVVLYTGADRALVRGQTVVRLSAGVNTVAFTWQTDKLDAASVRLEAPVGVAVGETIRPAGADKTLQWTLTTERGGDVAVTTSYQLAGLKFTPLYRLIVRPGATAGVLVGFITLTNESGLDLPNPSVQLVLGRPGVPTEQEAPPTFAIRGVTGLAPGASVRARFLAPIELGVRMLHRIDSARAPEQVHRVLGVQPPTTGPPARVALPAGPLTVISDTPGDLDDQVVTELTYEPAEEFEVNLGVERNLVVDRRLVERTRTRLEFDRLGRVSGLDTVERHHLQVRNHTSTEVALEVVEPVLDTWEFATDAPHVLEPGKAIMHLLVPADGSAELAFTITQHSGTRIP